MILRRKSPFTSDESLFNKYVINIEKACGPERAAPLRVCMEELKEMLVILSNLRDTNVSAIADIECARMLAERLKSRKEVLKYKISFLNSFYNFGVFV